MTIEEILKQLREGNNSDEVINALLDKLRTSVAGKVPTEDEHLKMDDMVGQLRSAFEILQGTPEGQARMRERLADRKEQRFIKKYTPFFDAILAGADVMSSLNQIRKARNAEKGLTQPSLPAIPGADPALNNAIRQAEVGTMDAARAIGPARQMVEDQYARDIANARAIGGGQAGTYGSLAQVAAMRRNRGAAGLAPTIDSIKAREQARLDALLQMRQQFQQQNYANRMGQARMNFDQYNQDMAAVGALGAAGRLNLRNSMQSLLYSTPRVAARLGVNGYPDPFSEYENQLNTNLAKERIRAYNAMPRPTVPMYSPNLPPILNESNDPFMTWSNT